MSFVTLDTLKISKPAPENLFTSLLVIHKTTYPSILFVNASFERFFGIVKTAYFSLF